LSAGLLADVRQQVIHRIAARQPAAEVVREVPFTATVLKAGPAFVLDALLKDESLTFRFDGLKRVDGPSKLGDFHYVPMLFHGGGAVRSGQRLLLEVYGLLLSRIQGRTPGSGVVWYGRECRATKVRLSTDPRRAERLLREVEQSRDSDPPRLILNDHCQVCEFRQRCHEELVGTGFLARVMIAPPHSKPSAIGRATQRVSGRAAIGRYLKIRGGIRLRRGSDAIVLQLNCRLKDA
jgi:predicted RecB family nuclease